MEKHKNIQKLRLTIALHIIFWSVIGLSYILVFWLVFDSGQLILRAVVNLSFLSFIFYFNTYVLVNKLLENKRYILFGIATFFIVVLFVPIRGYVNLIYSPPTIEMYGSQVERGFYVVAFASNLGIVLFSSFYQVLVNRLKAERLAEEVTARQNEAQLQFLRAQINPHFLFNTLNNIYSLAVSRSEKTAEMVLKLSNLLRYVVYDGKGEPVSLKKELEQIQQFIELFQMRSEAPLRIVFEKNTIPDRAFIEPMILIPIVENCFKHCDFDTNERAFVEMSARVEGSSLRFTTLNSKNDNDKQKDKSGGVGLMNIQRRLELQHPGKWKMSSNNHGTKFEVEACLPIVYKSKN